MWNYQESVHFLKKYFYRNFKYLNILFKFGARRFPRIKADFCQIGSENCPKPKPGAGVYGSGLFSGFPAGRSNFSCYSRAFLRMWNTPGRPERRPSA